MPEQFQRYFAENADYLGVLLEEYKWIASGAMREASLQELERHNESCFIDLMGRNYETSYANPDWAYAQLGETFGQLLSAVAAELRSLPAFFMNRIWKASRSAWSCLSKFTVRLQKASRRQKKHRSIPGSGIFSTGLQATMRS